MSASLEQVSQDAHHTLSKWIASCVRTRAGVSRNTVAVGVVVLDSLRHVCPMSREEAVSPGGEIKGARAGLGKLLAAYGLQGYLKEVTTRQAPQDGQRLYEALEWGNKFSGLTAAERDALLLELIDDLVETAQGQLARQNLKLEINRGHSPISWIQLILETARGRSGGVVEQHLVGAKLERRYQGVTVPNYPAHAADAQTGRMGDFAVEDTVYHVTATPSRAVLHKCAENIAAGNHPVLLVPREQENRAGVFAEEEGIERQVTVVSIEDFLALNIIELAAGRGTEFFAILQEIVEIYNSRLEAVETDLSLRIEVH